MLAAILKVNIQWEAAFLINNGNEKGSPQKYLRVLVEEGKNENAAKVNVRIPLALIRAGVRLAALLPHGVYDQVNKALKENAGVDFDVSQLKPEDFDELVLHLNELSVDVEGNRGEKARVFCE